MASPPASGLATNRVYAFSNLAGFIVYATFGGLLFIFPLYMQVVKRFPPQQAGLIMLAMPLCMAAISPLAGKLADRLPPHRVAAVGGTLMSLVLLLGASLSASTLLMLIIGLLAVMEFGFSLFASPNNYRVVSAVDSTRYGEATALLNTMMMVGQALGLSVVTLVVSIVMGRSPVTVHTAGVFLHSAHTIMLIQAVLGLAGVLLTLASPSNRGQPDRPAGNPAFLD